MLRRFDLGARLTWGSVALVAGFLLSTGCGTPEERFPVAGRVLVDGEPLTMGTIRFVPESGRPVASTIMADGSFDLNEQTLSSSAQRTGVPRGRYRVAVSASKVIDEDRDEVEWLAPSKYADHQTSGLVEVIEGPTSDLEITLTWEGNRPADEEGQEQVEQGSDQAPAAEEGTGAKP